MGGKNGPPKKETIKFGTIVHEKYGRCGTVPVKRPLDLA